MPRCSHSDMLSRLVLRPKNSSEGRKVGDAAVPHIGPTADTAAPVEPVAGLGSETHENGQEEQEDGNDSWAIVTRRRNRQQTRQLVIPQSQYAPLLQQQGPSTLMAFLDARDGDAAAEEEAEEAEEIGGDDGNMYAYAYEEMAALRAATRAPVRSQRGHRLRDRDRVSVHGSGVSGGSGSGIGSFRPASILRLTPYGRETIRRVSMKMGIGMGMGIEIPGPSLAGSSMCLATHGHQGTSMMAREMVVPGNRTLGGRVGKPMLSSRPAMTRRKYLHQNTAATTAFGSRGRVVHGASASLQRVRPSSRRPMPILPPQLVLASLLALPGFCLGANDGRTQVGTNRNDYNDNALVAAITQLARVLRHPAVVRRCGRSPHRRGLPRFLVLLLTFPLLAHHGKETFQRACGGYTPGDEHRPVFWAQYAAGFAAWLGLGEENSGAEDEEDGSGNDNDPFQGGQVLHTLVMRLSEGRRRFLEIQPQLMWEGHQPLASSQTNSASSPPPRTKSNAVDEDMDEAVDDDVDAAAAAVNDDTDLSDLVGKLRGARPDQLRLRVSRAMDAWLLFVARRRSEDIDPDLLAELSLD